MYVLCKKGLLKKVYCKFAVEIGNVCLKDIGKRDTKVATVKNTSKVHKHHSLKISAQSDRNYKSQSTLKG